MENQDELTLKESLQEHFLIRFIRWLFRMKGGKDKDRTDEQEEL